MKFLFILYYLVLPTTAETEIFDNTQIPNNLTTIQNNNSCVFQSTEHFVLKSIDASAKMYLTSTNVFEQLLNQLDFLPQLQPNIVAEDGTNWSTIDTFTNVFRFT